MDPVLTVAYAGVVACIVLAIILVYTAPRMHAPYDWQKAGDFR